MEKSRDFDEMVRILTAEGWTFKEIADVIQWPRVVHCEEREQDPPELFLGVENERLRDTELKTRYANVVARLFVPWARHPLECLHCGIKGGYRVKICCLFYLGREKVSTSQNVGEKTMAVLDEFMAARGLTRQWMES